jgi:hypothetical protein
MNNSLKGKPKIKLITLLPEYFQITEDKEMLSTEDGSKRANLLLARLSFKSRNMSFAIPWRSNIKNVDWIKPFIYPLPTTSKTRDNYIACFDYRKMCPIPKYAKSLYQQYKFDRFGNDINTMWYIQSHFKEILTGAQEYLYSYELNRVSYSVDINGGQYDGNAI